MKTLFCILMIILNESGDVMNANTMRLKELNTEKVRFTMRTGSIWTKSLLAKSTGLSVATCGNVLKDLLDSGEILEVEQGDSTGGRPSRQFEYNKDFGYLLLLYIRVEKGVKSMHYRISNLIGEVVDTYDQVFEQIGVSEIEATIEDVVAKYDRLKAISVGIPAVIKEGVASNITDFYELSEVDLQDYLQKQFKLPVSIENDVNVVAIGYFSANDFEEVDSIAYIYYPQDGCSGMGVVVGGNIIRGNSFFAGEVSFLKNIYSREDRYDKDQQKHHIATTINAVVCVLNPKGIVLSSGDFDNELVDSVREEVLEIIPAEHMPEITMNNDFHEDYMAGLSEIGFDLISCEIKIVER